LLIFRFIGTDDNFYFFLNKIIYYRTTNGFCNTKYPTAPNSAPKLTIIETAKISFDKFTDNGSFLFAMVLFLKIKNK